MRLALTAVPACLGIYDVRGVPHKSMPPRMRWLHPDAAQSFAEIAGWAVVSDMFRSPESSLAAVRAGRGAQPPGYSAHNYGLAIDVDIAASMKGAKLKSKKALDEAMKAQGWWCHRLDGVLGFEAWHYNFLGVGAKVAGSLTGDEVERRIVELYGAELAPDERECQRLLAKLRFYGGEVDGDVGPLTREAARAFERAWGLNVDGVLDAKTRRTLAYVAAAADR
jgi:hypothetical protein